MNGVRMFCWKSSLVLIIDIIAGAMCARRCSSTRQQQLFENDEAFLASSFLSCGGLAVGKQESASERARGRERPLVLCLLASVGRYKFKLQRAYSGGT